MIDRIQKDICVGCKACKDICPKEAIEFNTDREGFWHPSIDYERCIVCNRCEEVCPVNDDRIRGSENKSEDMTVKGYKDKSPKKSEYKYRKPRVYAAYCTNKRIRYNSTSGGVYYALAIRILSEGGYLVGCAFTEDYHGAVHVAVRDKAGLRRLMRSKYFQSDAQGIYIITKRLLEEGKQVLFAGTPCQIGALKAFLSCDYPRLYTCDFICRGVNSPLAYRKYLEELEDRYHSKVKEVHFKNKQQGWTSLGTMIKFNNNKMYFRNRNTDPWVNGFIMENLYIRPACSNCKFKTLPRVSDITMGDFWGLPLDKEEEELGVSAVLVNSERGSELLQKAAGVLTLKRHSFEDVLKGNPALFQSVPLSEKRKEFFSRISNEKYSSVVWELLGLGRQKWRIRYCDLIIKKYLQKLKHYLMQR